MFNVNAIREDFPMIQNHQDLIYFDNSATTFKPKVVIDKVVDYYSNYNSNIHRGEYDLSYYVSSEYDNGRKVIKKFINAKEDDEIVYTSGSTLSLNMVAFGYGLTHLKKGDIILTTLEEHASNILPWFKVAEKTGAIVKYIDLNDDGTFNIDKYKDSLNEHVKIVSIPFVSNVLGYINPIKEITKLAHKYNAIVNIDGAQAVPHIKIDVQDLDIDFLSFSSHKIYGPSGAGVLYGKIDLLKETEPLVYGGGSNARFDKEGNIILRNIPYLYESGTPAIEGILGMIEAIEYVDKIGLDNISNYESSLSKYLVDKLLKLDNIEVINPKTNTGIVSFNAKGIFAQDLASYLNKKRICVRSGNHCAKILHNVINTDQSVRASLSFYNTKEEVDYLVDVLKDATLEKCVEAIL